MIKKLYAVYDVKAKTELGIMEQVNDLVAIRDFSQGCANKDSPLAKFPEDYQLMCLGEIDTETNIITSNVRTLATATEYVQKEETK